MPLIKPTFRPGVNRENTRYKNEGGWYESQWVRFRQGSPEKIGGWTQYSSYSYQGVCRSLWNWITLSAQNIVGVGTSLKYYLTIGDNYYDITPIRLTQTLTNPFTATANSTTIRVSATSHGANVNDFVTFSGATGLGGNITAAVLNQQYQVTSVPDANSFTFVATATANSTDAAGSPGGGTVTAAYQVNTGPSVQTPFTGWGAGGWGYGTWGNGQTVKSNLQIWNAYNFGQNLLFGPRGGGFYYWTAPTLTNPGVALNSLGGNVTITASTPALVTATNVFVQGTGLQFGGNLPPGMSANTTYYVRNVNGTQFNLADANGNLVGTPAPPNVQGVVTTGGVGSMVPSQTGAIYATGVRANANAGSVSATVTSGVILLNSIQAGGSVGNVSAFGVGAALTGDFALGSVGTVSNGGVTFGLTGVSAAGDTGTPTVTGVYNAYISLIVDVPLFQNYLQVSDASNFVIVFGTNDYGSSTLDPMLIRWSDQQNPLAWYPDITNQAGSVRLSHGSQIVTAIQTRQEIFVLTDAAVYSLQYLGPPYVWGTQLLGENTTIIGPNAATIASGVVYWMGIDKFYIYDGRVQTLNCDLRRFVFQNLNYNQNQQVYCSTVEGFNEVWWFYVSGTGTQMNAYVVYNYVEKTWYYGSIGRTAWLDTTLQNNPIGATYNGYLCNQESGLDNNETGTPAPIDAYIASSEFDIADQTGDHFAFITKVLPDLTFENSTATTPTTTMTIYGLQNSGSGVTSNQTKPNNVYSVDISANPDTFTGYVYTRIRGRQFIFKMESNQLGTAWQLGAPRFDARPDGRR